MMGGMQGMQGMSGMGNMQGMQGMSLNYANSQVNILSEVIYRPLDLQTMMHE